MSAAWLAGNAELAGVGVQVASKAEFFANADAICAAPNGAVILKASDTIVDVVGAVKSATSASGATLAEALSKTGPVMLMEKVYQQGLSDKDPFKGKKPTERKKWQEPDKKKKKKRHLNKVAKTAMEKAIKRGYVPLEDELSKLEKEFGTLKGYKECGGKDVTLDLKHIFQPNTNKYDKPVGFHHNYKGYWADEYNVVKTKDLRGDCYIARWTNNVNVRPRTSSFFSDNMGRVDVVKLIKEAYCNLTKVPQLNDNGKYLLTGMSSNGIIVRMEILKNGFIETAYPFIKEMIL